MEKIRAHSRETTYVPHESENDHQRKAAANGAKRRAEETKRRAFVAKLTKGQQVTILWTYTDGERRTMTGTYKGVKLWCRDKSVQIATVSLKDGKIVRVDAMRLRRK